MTNSLTWSVKCLNFVEHRFSIFPLHRTDYIDVNSIAMLRTSASQIPPYRPRQCHQLIMHTSYNIPPLHVTTNRLLLLSLQFSYPPFSTPRHFHADSHLWILICRDFLLTQRLKDAFHRLLILPQSSKRAMLTAAIHNLSKIVQKSVKKSPSAGINHITKYLYPIRYI